MGIAEQMKAPMSRKRAANIAGALTGKHAVTFHTQDGPSHYRVWTDGSHATAPPEGALAEVVEIRAEPGFDDEALIADLLLAVGRWNDPDGSPSADRLELRELASLAAERGLLGPF